VTDIFPIERKRGVGGFTGVFPRCARETKITTALERERGAVRLEWG